MSLFSSHHTCTNNKSDCKFVTNAQANNRFLFCNIKNRQMRQSSIRKSSVISRQQNVRKEIKTSYKHVPHCQKPTHIVAKRNARERKRVQTVNDAFALLRKHVPRPSKSNKVSKVAILKVAMEYIQSLQSMIFEHDKMNQRPSHRIPYPDTYQETQQLRRSWKDGNLVCI